MNPEAVFNAPSKVNKTGDLWPVQLANIPVPNYGGASLDAGYEIPLEELNSHIKRFGAHIITT